MKQSKRDLTGADAVGATFKAIDKLGLKTKDTGLLALGENMPGAPLENLGT